MVLKETKYIIPTSPEIWNRRVRKKLIQQGYKVTKITLKTTTLIKTEMLNKKDMEEI